MAKPKLSLCFHAELKKYTLRFEGAEELGVFPSSHDAIQYAATIVKEETQLTVYDMAGKVLIVTSVYPAMNWPPPV